MNIIGIIAEYNPFHNGHLYQIKKIKEMYKDSLLVVILNGNFSQRGDASIIDKWDKTKIILDHDVDLVLELPLFFGINNANIFAYGSLKILNELKIDTLVFGSESNDINTLKEIANIKINNKDYDSILKDELDKGFSFPKASSNAVNSLMNKIINSPNDILGISYIEEILKNKYNINPICIKRTNDYHSNDINEVSSASAIRNAIKNNKDYKKAIPTNVIKYIQEPVFIEDYYDLLKYKILSSKDLTIYHGIEEGIENRINKFISKCNTLEELIQSIKTKRYTYNRIKRTLLYILLDITKDDINKVTTYIRPLGFTKKGLEYLNKVKKEFNIPLISNYSKNKDILYLEYRANLIYSLKKKNIELEILKELNKPIIKGNEL